MSQTEFNIYKSMPLALLLRLPKAIQHRLIIEYPLLNKFALKK